MTTCVAFQPTYFPDLHYLHRMAAADVIIVMDNVQFNRHVWHHRATTPFGHFTVPIRRDGHRRKYTEVATEPNGWQADHIARLAKQYPSAIHTLGPAFDTISRFSADYCAGIQRVYQLVLEMLPNDPDVVWQSTYAGGLKSTGVELLRDLCIAVNADTYITGEQAMKQYMNGGDVLLDAGIDLQVQFIDFPKYGNIERIHYNWSSLDVMATLGFNRAMKYLDDLRTQGWNRYAATA